MSLSLANGLERNMGAGPGEFPPPTIIRGLKGGESVVKDDPLFFKTAAAIVKKKGVPRCGLPRVVTTTPGPIFAELDLVRL